MTAVTDDSRGTLISGLADRPLKDHPLRVALTNEVHARPSEYLEAPIRATVLAMLSGEGAADAERTHLERLCQWAGVPKPSRSATHYSGSFGTFRLKWERHTEFSTYTIFRPGRSDEMFAEPALDALPPEWLGGMPGQMMVGVHVVLRESSLDEPDPGQLAAVFGSDSYAGNRVAGGAATAWTDFRIHGDGFSRILIQNHSMSPWQAGRYVQRLMEIEIYRVMALLALPVTRQVLPRIGAIETELAALTAHTTDLQGLEDEREVLDRLTRLSAQTEQIAAEASYRFGAARAYFGIVERRIGELRSVRIEGLQTVGEFMERRLTPASRTCDAVQTRVEALSQRLARASNLLRTRVEIAVEGQNAQLLKSMDHRAEVQLRLQETVEGLSVVAISYYLIGIVGYAAKSLKGFGLKVDPDLVIGLMIPVVLLFVWNGVRRIRKVLASDH